MYFKFLNGVSTAQQYYLKLHFLEIHHPLPCSFPPIEQIGPMSCSEVTEVSWSYVLYMFLYYFFHFNLILWQGFNPPL